MPTQGQLIGARVVSLSLPEGLSIEEIAVATAAGFVVDSVTFPFSAFAMDKLGRKYAGIPASLFLALGFALVGFVSDLWQLCLAAAVLGTCL